MTDLGTLTNHGAKLKSHVITNNFEIILYSPF